MRFSASIPILCVPLIGFGRLAGAVPCSNITDVAGGGIPNGDMPLIISPAAIKGFRLAIFLELLEYSYFSSNFSNITNLEDRGYVNGTTDLISKIIAQEEVHIATFVEILDAYIDTPILPCNYSFPVTSTDEFLELAEIITSVGISATLGLAERLAVTDPLLVKSISSILTVEARHDTLFRSLKGLTLNPAPFDTRINDIWAYNLALSFIIPGSCQFEVPLPILPALNVSNPYSNSTTDMSYRDFTWDPTQIGFVAEDGKELLVGWVNQLNAPVYTPLNVTARGKGTAAVPQGMNGVVFAAITTQYPESVNDLALGTLAGPAVMRLS